MSQTAETVAERPAKLPTIVAGAKVQPIVPGDFDSAYRIAQAVCVAGMAPKGLDSPERAFVAIMHGLEVGFPPMQALQSIAVINGRPSIWGDGALGLVQASGLMESHKEWFEGTGEQRKALCLVKRKGDPEMKLGEFSVADAKTAGLWKKSGPWTQYSDRMLKMRARAFALRDGFSDVLRGLSIAEEASDIPAAAKDVTPLSPPPAPKALQPPKVPETIHVPESRQGRMPLAKESETDIDPIDPAQWLDDVTSRMRMAESAELVEEIWETDCQPREDEMPAPEFLEARDCYRACLDKFSCLDKF